LDKKTFKNEGKNMQMIQTQKRFIMSLLFIAFVIALLLVLNAATGGKFLSAGNITAIIVNASVPTLVAWGFMFIFASGIIDLSVGAVIILAANIAGTVGNSTGYVGLVVSGIVAGIVLVTINFTIFQVSKIPSWIAGLGMTMAYEAISSLYSQYRLKSGLRVVDLEQQYRALGRAPMVFVVLVIAFLLAYFLYNRTTVGLNIRAMGSNQSVSKIMGISMSKTVIYSGLVAGIFIGMAAVANESFAGTVNAVSGLASLATTFQPLAAVLLSQALQKYMNISIAVFVSTVFIMAVFNVLTLLGVASGTWQETILGLSVIVFGIAAQKRSAGVLK
jgi:ribose transport system permease protein